MDCTGALNAQANLLIHTFRYNYSLGLLLFGIHLLLVGYLILRSWYIPRWLGAWLLLDGLAWVVNSLQPYLYPDANLGFLFVGFLAELAFMLWLLIGGWLMKPAPAQAPAT